MTEQVLKELQPVKNSVLVVGRIPFIPGIGYDPDGFIKREYGNKLQEYYRTALSTCVTFIAQKETASIMITPQPPDDEIARLYGGLFTFEPEVADNIITNRPPAYIPVDKRIAFYPQDCFIAGEGIVAFVDQNSQRFFSSHFPADKFTILVDKDLGEGGKTKTGSKISFYTTTDHRQVDPVTLKKLFKGKAVIYLPSPKEVGIEDKTRAVKVDHIDQMVGPDIYIESGNESFFLVPIDDIYQEKLNAQGALPCSVSVEINGQIQDVPTRFLSIKKDLINMMDLLNTPYIHDKIYMGPVLGNLIGLYLQALHDGQNPDSVTNQFQEQILRENSSTFPDLEDWKREITPEGRLTYHQSKFFKSVLPRFAAWKDQAKQLIQNLPGIEILPTEIPATTSIYFVAGLKCKINFIG